MNLRAPRAALPRHAAVARPLAASVTALLAVAAARCGARTGLDGSAPTHASSSDAAAEDASPDASTLLDGTVPGCPADEPTNGTDCQVGLSCAYASGIAPGCTASCSCGADGWTCASPAACQFPPCPHAPPPRGSSCFTNQICDYALGAICTGLHCVCVSPGEWSCQNDNTGCADP